MNDQRLSSIIDAAIGDSAQKNIVKTIDLGASDLEAAKKFLASHGGNIANVDGNIIDFMGKNHQDVLWRVMIRIEIAAA